MSALPTSAQTRKSAAPRDELRDFLIRLRAAADGSSDCEALLASVGTPPSVTVRITPSPQKTCTMTFNPTVPAHRVAVALRWGRVYAVSHDVHQRGWLLGALDTRGLPAVEKDESGRKSTRIGLRDLTLGGFAVEARLKGRPAGPLPRFVSGPSPAYPVDTYSAEIVSLTLAAHESTPAAR